MAAPRKENLTADELGKLFAYDPETGSLTWRVAACRGTIQPGTPIGKQILLRHDGKQILLRHDGKRVCYVALRVAWCLHHGAWPDGTLFLYNGNPKDRSIKNIGLAPNPPADGILTAEYLRKVLHYEPETGNFFHAVTQPGGNAQFGQLAGSIGKDGRRRIRVGGKKYLANRLAWLYVHGEWPEDQLDHRNGQRDEDRIGNLRPANNSQNMANRKYNGKSRSGIKGIHLRKDGRFTAHCNGWASKSFKTLDEAITARRKAEVELQGEFAFSQRGAHFTDESLRPSALAFANSESVSAIEARC
jgi:hypothetical protein